MTAQRIILVNCSRLLGDMLRTVICRADHLEMVQEVTGDEELPKAIEKSEAEWVIMSVPSDQNIPYWVNQYVAKHPSMRFLVIFPGVNKVKLKWLEYEEDVEELSLTGLIHILEGHPQHAW